MPFRLNAFATLTIIAPALLYPGCHTAALREAPEADRRELTIEQIEGLQSMEQVLPMPPDSVIVRYRAFDRSTFYATFQRSLAEVARLVDSLNSGLPAERRVDTLSIDHTIEGFGDAASRGRTLYISSSYFYLFPGTTVLRSVVFHEFGHIHARMLDSLSRVELIHTWSAIRSAALFYLFRDGEYSGNARFGGHPEESPEELYASGFNLFANRADEIITRLGFVDPHNRRLAEGFRTYLERTIR